MRAATFNREKLALASSWYPLKFKVPHKFSISNRAHKSLKYVAINSNFHCEGFFLMLLGVMPFGLKVDKRF